MLELTRLSELARRQPHQLSGGQQQRVALARALANAPDVVLLDEPLSALDAKLRSELRFDLKNILKTTDSTVIVVTHDQVEALSIGDRVLVMSAGRLVQEGDPNDVYARPRSRFVAEFLGRMNWLGACQAQHAEGGAISVELADGSVIRAEPSVKITSPFHLAVRPERLRIAAGDLAESCNRLSGTVVATAFVGSEMQIDLRLSDGSKIFVVAQNLGQAIPQSGESLDLFFQPEDCILVPTNELD
jgi:putative spermidine/putrescine transport system ATP-binding protein/putrescine transport system ATP-binding protein